MKSVEERLAALEKEVEELREQIAPTNWIEAISGSMTKYGKDFDEVLEYGREYRKNYTDCDPTNPAVE